MNSEPSSEETGKWIGFYRFASEMNWVDPDAVRKVKGDENGYCLLCSFTYGLWAYPHFFENHPDKIILWRLVGDNYGR